jgi:hypothetical protein
MDDFPARLALTISRWHGVGAPDELPLMDAVVVYGGGISRA